jgi:CBS domain-containing protein
MLARDIMDTRFHTLKPHETVARAVKMFQTAGREEGKKIFGLIVVDDADRLVGMLSMYDILLFIQPKHMKIWGEMEDLEPDRLFEDLLGKVKGIQVGDIMTTEVVTIGPETHILSISDVMTTSVRACKTDDTLAEVIEELTTHRCGAVLIRNPGGSAAGVISKTDLAIAYKHGEKTGTPAKVVMRRPVLSCDANDFLCLALQQMLLKDVQRLFVYEDDPARIVGVLSLSDSARFRSGSCRACTSGRLIVGV